jgi:hypothetical protein
VTNPFSRFLPRLKYYHIFSWIVPLIVTAFPFFVNQYESVYGFFYVSNEINDQAFCWLKIQSENELGPPMTIFFFVPLNVVYFINVFALIIAYTRLRKGLNRSFLPRLKILVSGAVHVFVLILFWFFFFLTYGWAFYNRDNRTYNGGMFACVNCIMASKGFSVFITWILTTNKQTLKNLDGEEEKIEDNVALREEVLTFATAGIRSTARAGPTVSAEKQVLVRRPQTASRPSAMRRSTDPSSVDSKDNSTTVVTPYFFLKFMLGQAEEFTAIEALVSNKRRSVDDNFQRQTVASHPSQFTATASGRGTSSALPLPLNLSLPFPPPTVAGGAAAGDRDPSHSVRVSSMRLSQRATLPAGASRETQGPGPGGAQQVPGLALPPLLSSNPHPSTGSMTLGHRPFQNSDLSDLEQGEAEEGGGEDNRGPSEFSQRSTDMIAVEPEEKEGRRRQSFFRSIYETLLNYLMIGNNDQVEFYEYQPYHFRRVRMAFGVNDAVYIK